MSVGKIVSLSLTIIGLLAALGLWGCPQYNVWKKGMSGKAKLMEAEQTKKILIESARAEVEAARHRAEAVQIMGQAAKDFPEYRLQEFMAAFAEALQSEYIDQIIYVPTEANVPILEAGKR